MESYSPDTKKKLAVHGYTLGLKEWPDKYQIHTDLRNVQLTNIDNIIIQGDCHGI